LARKFADIKRAAQAENEDAAAKAARIAAQANSGQLDF